jgi:hypothetical protein
MDYSAQTKVYQDIISLYNIDLKNVRLYTALLNSMYPTKKEYNKTHTHAKKHITQKKHMFEILPTELKLDTHIVINVYKELNQTHIEELIEVNKDIGNGIIYSNCELINKENVNI